MKRLMHEFRYYVNDMNHINTLFEFRKETKYFACHIEILLYEGFFSEATRKSAKEIADYLMCLGRARTLKKANEALTKFLSYMAVLEEEEKLGSYW